MPWIIIVYTSWAPLAACSNLETNIITARTVLSSAVSTVEQVINPVFVKKMAEEDVKYIEKLCRVCGALAGKHIYYGARTCISCRGFFRRSVQSNHYKFFCCSANQKTSCLLTVKTRKNCKKCRFAKCLSVGMKITWVLSDEERNQRMIQRSRHKVSPTATIQNHLKLLNFGDGEKNRIEMFYSMTMELFNRLSYRMYASDLTTMRSCFINGFNGRPFTFTEVKFFESVDQFVVTELVFKMFKMHNVKNMGDVRLLAVHNVPRLVGLYQSLVCKVIFEIIAESTIDFKQLLSSW